MKPLLVAFLVLGSCAKSTAPVIDVGSVATLTQPSHPPQVVITTQDGRRLGVSVEVARTSQEREKGLMFRKELAPDAGMLFVFEEDQDHMFWMKNTLIALDMLFINSDGVVVGIVQDAQPETLTPRAVNQASRYVLEVNTGWAALKGVRTGDRVDVSAIRP